MPLQMDYCYILRGKNRDFRCATCKSWCNLQLLAQMKGVVAVLTLAGSLTVAACSWFGPVEAVRHESARTVYRAAEETPLEVPEVMPVREKVPGETR